MTHELAGAREPIDGEFFRRYYPDLTDAELGVLERLGVVRIFASYPTVAVVAALRAGRALGEGSAEGD